MSRLYNIFFLIVISNVCCVDFSGLSQIGPSLLFPNYMENFTNTAINDCSDFQPIPNADAEVQYHNNIKFVQITCHENYSLIGRSIIYCESNQWSLDDETPRCDKRCPPPPFLENGNVSLEKRAEDKFPSGTYLRGTIAKYTCSFGYRLKPPTSRIRVCDDGQWSGFDAFCDRIHGCMVAPKMIENGYYQIMPEDPLAINSAHIGQKVRYHCQEGYSLIGSSKIECNGNGEWMPQLPTCQKDIGNPFVDFSASAPATGPVSNGVPDFFAASTAPQPVPTNQNMWGANGISSTNAFQAPMQQPTQPTQQPFNDLTDLLASSACDSVPLLNPKAHARIEISSISSTTVDVGCQAKYRNALSPCQTSKFYCQNGKWVGVYPECVNVQECFAPPPIPYAVVVDRNFETNYDANGLPIYPIHSEITYECLKGYVLEGSPVLTCGINGCWEPSLMPVCIGTKDNYFLQLNNINAILISSATGAGVLGILLLACLVVACRKRKALTRAVSIETPSATPTSRHHSSEVINDHAVLLQHPDRLALIAFADGVHNSQNSLPSYDEATRDRTVSSNLTQINRLQIHRPHWPNVTICRGSGRSRSSSNTDSSNFHLVHHSSFVSHTPSMRSGGDSMGSTDTVTISEGSTNVTLDTASSHSGGSQNPSCRGHCGSLASFDGCSVVNTEGVPLLEESELEDIHGGSIELENPVASDNSSSKMSTHSAPIMTN